VPLRELWKKAPKDKGLFLQGTNGIKCPGCGVKLRVLQMRVVIATSLLFAIAMGVAAYIGDYDRAHNIHQSEASGLLISGAAMSVLFYFQWRFAYRFASVRILRDGVGASFPLTETEPFEVPDEAPLDLALLSKVAARWNTDKEDSAVWICPKCKEDNPGEFDRCWKCQTERTGTSN